MNATLEKKTEMAIIYSKNPYYYETQIKIVKIHVIFENKTNKYIYFETSDLNSKIYSFASDLTIHIVDIVNLQLASISVSRLIF